MKQIMKQIVKKIVAKVFRFMTRIGVFKPSKVILIDGGVCSQILQYYQGVVHNPDYQAEFDMFFWDKNHNGIDGLGNENRPFELLTIFPQLPFIRCDKKKAAFYRKYMQTNMLSLPPIYENNYRLYGCSLVDLHTIFNKEFAVLPDNKMHLIGEIQKNHSCGIHIRRGDLANNDNPYYGVFSEEYLIEAMDYVKRIDDEVKFYAFSDDLVWVKTVFMEKCGYPIRMMEGNSGGEDLILLANCMYIIASQGTAGRLAALIGGDGMLIMKEGDPHNAQYLEAHKNCVLL